MIKHRKNYFLNHQLRGAISFFKNTHPKYLNYLYIVAFCVPVLLLTFQNCRMDDLIETSLDGSKSAGEISYDVGQIVEIDPTDDSFTEDRLLPANSDITFKIVNVDPVSDSYKWTIKRGFDYVVTDASTNKDTYQTSFSNFGSHDIFAISYQSTEVKTRASKRVVVGSSCSLNDILEIELLSESAASFKVGDSGSATFSLKDSTNFSSIQWKATLPSGQVITNEEEEEEEEEEDTDTFEIDLSSESTGTLVVQVSAIVISSDDSNSSENECLTYRKKEFVVGSNVTPYFNPLSFTDGVKNIPLTLENNDIYKYERPDSDRYLQIEVLNANSCQYQINNGTQVNFNCSGDSIKIPSSTGTSCIGEVVTLLASNNQGATHSQSYYYYCAEDGDYCYFGLSNAKPGHHECIEESLELASTENNMELDPKVQTTTTQPQPPTPQPPTPQPPTPQPLTPQPPTTQPPTPQPPTPQPPTPQPPTTQPPTTQPPTTQPPTPQPPTPQPPTTQPPTPQPPTTQPPDPCASVSCSNGKVCRNGSCVCPSGQCCPSCTGGQQCQNGSCVTPDPCGGVISGPTSCGSCQRLATNGCTRSCVSTMSGPSSCSGSCQRLATNGCTRSCVSTVSGPSSCSGSCQRLSTTGCTRSCVSTMSGPSSCSGSCQRLATNGCTRSCVSTVSGPSSCSGSCQRLATNGCTRSCVSTVSGPSSCSGSCQRLATNGCTRSCVSTVSGPSSCSGSCQRLATNGCTRSCVSTVSGPSSCSGSCQRLATNGCTRSCVSTVSGPSSCSGSCQRLATNGCTRSCVSTVSGPSSCSGSCQRLSTTGCTRSCVSTVSGPSSCGSGQKLETNGCTRSCVCDPAQTCCGGCGSNEKCSGNRCVCNTPHYGGSSCLPSCGHYANLNNADVSGRYCSASSDYHAGSQVGSYQTCCTKGARKTCSDKQQEGQIECCNNNDCSDNKECRNNSCVCPSGDCCPACPRGQVCNNGSCQGGGSGGNPIPCDIDMHGDMHCLGP